MSEDSAGEPGTSPQDRGHFEAGIRCPKCHAVNAVEDALFKAYFETGGAVCTLCAEGFDPWKKALQDLAVPMVFASFGLIGCTHTVVNTPLEPNSSTRVDLSTSGIPVGAEILDIRISNIVSGGEGPSLLASLAALHTLSFDPLPHWFYLYGATFGKIVTSRTVANMIVTWVQPGPDEIAVHHLLRQPAGPPPAPGRAPSGGARVVFWDVVVFDGTNATFPLAPAAPIACGNRVRWRGRSASTASVRSRSAC